ncbi:hypothetical protein Prudu_012409, partial [Prunus dulcis]
LLIPLSLLSPVTFSLFLSLSRANWAVRPFAFSATARSPQAEPISAVGTIGSVSVSPSGPDQSQPRGRPELAEKPCFPAEVPSKPPEFSAQNSPSFLHQIDRVRHQEPDRITKETFDGSKGDSVEISAEV